MRTDKTIIHIIADSDSVIAEVDDGGNVVMTVLWQDLHIQLTWSCQIWFRGH